MITLREFQERCKAAKKPTELPPMLVFKRKAIRVLASGQRVAEYHSAATNTTIIYPSMIVQN